jgi:hypothetical protein
MNVLQSLAILTAPLLLLVNTLKLFAMITMLALKTIVVLPLVVYFQIFLNNAGLVISAWKLIAIKIQVAK